MCLIKWGNEAENLFSVWDEVSPKGAKERRKLSLNIPCLTHNGFSLRQLTGGQSGCSRAKRLAKTM